jgi:hypothetical protein
MGFVALFAGLALQAAEPPAPVTPPAATPAPPAQPGPQSTVGEVVVQAQKPITGDMQRGVLAYQPSFFINKRPSTAMDMVQWLPGFSFQDTRDVRGLEGSGGNVLIDGKPPTSKTDTLQSVLRRIPAEQIERIDIISGGQPGIDMHGWPVIANVILKKDANKRRTVTVAGYGDAEGRGGGTLSLNSSTKNDKRTVEASLDAGQALNSNPVIGEGTWTRVDGAGAKVFDANPRAVQTGPYAVASGAYDQALAGGRLRFNGSGRYSGQNYYEHDRLRYGPEGTGFTHLQTYEQGEFGAAYEYPLSKKTSLETTVLERLTHYWANNDLNRPPAPSVLDKLQDSAETVARVTARYKPKDSFSLEAAAEGAFNTAETRSRETQSGAPVALPNSNVDLRESRGDVGVTATWKPDAKFSAEAGVKAEHSTLTGSADAPVDRSFDYLKPRAVLTWAPNKDSQVRLHVEHEVDQLDFGLFVAGTNWVNGQNIAGNVQVRPQQDWLSELVLERHFWSTGDLSLTFRHKKLIDQIDEVPIALPDGSLIPIAQNIGGGWQNDFVINLLIPFKPLGLSGATLKTVLTWTGAEVTDPVSHQKRMPSGQAGFQGELHFAEDLPSWKLNVGVDAYANGPSKNYTPFGDTTQGPWGQFILFTEYRPTSQWSIRGQVGGMPGLRMRQVIDTFTGLKDQSPLFYRDTQNLGIPVFFNLRFRRQFY